MSEKDDVYTCKWIKTTEDLPPVDQEVLVSDGSFVTIGELASYGQWRVLNGLGVVEPTLYYEKSRITYWMPKPQLPE